MKGKSIAVIDCGTNTFNLLIAFREKGKWRALFRTRRVVKLGSEGIKDGLIGNKPRARAMKALLEYRRIIKKFNACKITVVGTAALRDAKNGNEILSEIKQHTGFSVQLIDGNREAELIYSGVKQALEMPDGFSLIMDIGGGSTEFIICNRSGIAWKRSFRLGAARLLEYLKPSDPISASQVRNLNNYLERELQPLLKAVLKYKPERLIGSSGSFDTFAGIILKKEGRSLRRKTHYLFEFSDYRKLHEELIKSTYKERLIIPGMLRMRADMIHLASLLLTFVLRKCKIREMHLSTYALKEGLLAESINAVK